MTVTSLASLQRFALRSLFALCLLASFVACKGEHDHDHGHDHKHGHDHDRGHSHSAPHGGVLVELEDHVANVEFTFDEKTGTLNAYCLGGHAKKGLIPSNKSLDVEVKAGDKTIPLKLSGIANSLTGETKDKTSQFGASDDQLKSLKSFSGTLKSVTLKGKEYKNVAFSVSKK